MIKRIAFTFSLMSFALLLTAQIRVVGKHQLMSDALGVDKLILFDKIDNSSTGVSSELHYKSNASNAFVQWFVYQNSTLVSLSNINRISNRETYIEPQHNQLYLIKEDGAELWIFVVDADLARSNTTFTYFGKDGESRQYNSQKNENKAAAIQKSIADKQDDDDDNQAESDKIACKITTITAERDGLHENQRPNQSSITGSAPLDIQLFSNPEGDVRQFSWQIFKEGELIRNESNQDIQHVFEVSGKYRVLIEVRNDTETASDSINIDISESQLMVPSVFTPNGDGINDEFRVAYTSISQFQATVVNRWGRTVFSWNDPQKGWNGKIGGKDAPEGTYFYIITATGSEGKAYKLKGHVNLLR